MGNLNSPSRSMYSFKVKMEYCNSFSKSYRQSYQLLLYVYHLLDDKSKIILKESLAWTEKIDTVANTNSG